MGRAMTDMGLDAGDDLAVMAGDLVMEESTLQHMRQLLLNNKGDYKADPTICVGAARYLNDDNGYPALIREITTQYALDGINVQRVELNREGEIVSNAEYK
jgi:hypothetical protein